MASVVSYLSSSVRRRRGYLYLSLLVVAALLLVYLLFRQSDAKTSSIPVNVGLPTLYEYYSEGGVASALEEEGEHFVLNSRRLRILSGSIHYFRVPPEYWRDRLRKLRAAGFNTVMTYVAWNMHEKLPGKFDFTGKLDLPKFIQIAKEEDLLVIVRPGPYICSEFEFGGLPAWLLKDPFMQVRRTYVPYHQKISTYFKELFEKIKHLQWSPEYGAQPIIAMQVENEYATFMYGLQPDSAHMNFLIEEMKLNNMKYVLYFTSDSVARYGNVGAAPGALMTVNTGGSADNEFAALDELQPGRPKMVVEFWAGWFDHWSEQHHTKRLSDFVAFAENILSKDASINLYMFHGGTNYGFYNGANAPDRYQGYIPTVSSYDYDAPLSESGDYTAKYYRIKQLIDNYNTGPTLKRPPHPKETTKTVYKPVEIKTYLSLEQILDQSESENSASLVGMESLKVKQTYLGFIVYSQQSVKLSSPESTLTIKGRIRDIAYIVVDGGLISKPITTGDEFLSTGFWGAESSEYKLKGDDKEHTIHIVVEVMGRVNFGNQEALDQKKGLHETKIFLDDVKLENWKITPMGFEETWLKELKGWKDMDASVTGPSLLQGTLYIDQKPMDTWLDMRTWTKGVVFVNGFNLGRYWNIGPTQTMFLPAPFLTQGANEILIFEIYEHKNEILFIDKPIL